MTGLGPDTAPIGGSNLGVYGPLFTLRHDFVYGALKARTGNTPMVRGGEMANLTAAIDARMTFSIIPPSFFHNTPRQMELLRLGISLVPNLIGEDACILQKLKAIVKPVVNGDTGAQLDANLGLTPSRFVDIIGYE